MLDLSPASLYFSGYWTDLLTGISSDRELLKSFNPRIVILELLDEITINKKRNISNERFFTKIIGEYIKNDPGSKSRLKTHLQMILTEISLSKNRPKYLPALCTSALDLFNNLYYFEDCIAYLTTLISLKSLSKEQKDEIKLIANHLIVELRVIGFTEDEIKKIPTQIFSTMEESTSEDESTFHWDFPHLRKFDNWANKTETIKFKNELKEYQSKLTENERINSLLKIARKEPESITYIFRVNGIIGDSNLKIGSVEFYSPSKKRLATHTNSEIENDDELFWSKPGEEVINAAVTVSAKSYAAGEITARSIIERSLALARRTLTGELPLWLGRSFIALNSSGEIIGGTTYTFQRTEDDFTKKFKLNLKNKLHDEKEIDSILKMQKTAEQNGWGRRFNEACYWLRKAEESSSNVEKLLSYWICIETLCAKSDSETINWLETKNGEHESDIYLIREIIGKSIAINNCYRYGWLIYNTLRNPIALLHGIKIPSELAIKAQLKTTNNDTIKLKNLITHTSEIEQYIDNEILKEQIHEFGEFYTKKDTALNTLKKNLETAQDELLFIYRMRNKIAHDGNSDHFLLPYLCNLAARYATFFFKKIEDMIIDKQDADLRSVLIKSAQEYDRIELRLKTESPSEVFLKHKDEI